MRLLLSEFILNSSPLRQSATDPVQDGFIGIQLLPPAATMTEDEMRIAVRNKVETLLKWKAEEGAIVLLPSGLFLLLALSLLFYIMLFFVCDVIV